MPIIICLILCGLRSKLSSPAYQPIADGYILMDRMRTQGRLGPDVLWLADMQQDKHENLYVDVVHYNAAFSKEIAGRICDFIDGVPNSR